MCVIRSSMGLSLIQTQQMPTKKVVVGRRFEPIKRALQNGESLKFVEVTYRISRRLLMRLIRQNDWGGLHPNMIESMRSEGYSAPEISKALNLPLEHVREHFEKNPRWAKKDRKKKKKMKEMKEMKEKKEVPPTYVKSRPFISPFQPPAHWF